MRKPPTKLTDTQVQDILTLYVYEKQSARQIAQIFNCDSKTITSVLHKNNIDIIRHPSVVTKLSKVSELSIIQDYNSGLFTIVKLAKKYQISRAVIYQILDNNSINHTANFDLLSKYTLNKLYFDNIDTEDKAYFLGLLYADGNNYTKNGRIAISLQEQDKYILNEFNKRINSNRPLSFRDRKSKNIKHKNQYRLDIVNRYMSNSLNKLGCVNKKSLILKFPNSNQVPHHLLSHFIRGMIDGDGCISLSQNKLRVTLTSTLSFCQSLQLLMLESLNISSCITNRKNNKQSTRQICFSGSNATTFLNFIYNKANIYLLRKFNIWTNHTQHKKHIPQF